MKDAMAVMAIVNMQQYLVNSIPNPEISLDEKTDDSYYEKVCANYKKNTSIFDEFVCEELKK